MSITPGHGAQRQHLSTVPPTIPNPCGVRHRAVILSPMALPRTVSPTPSPPYRLPSRPPRAAPSAASGCHPLASGIPVGGAVPPSAAPPPPPYLQLRHRLPPPPQRRGVDAREAGVHGQSAAAAPAAAPLHRQVQQAKMDKMNSSQPTNTPPPDLPALAGKAHAEKEKHSKRRIHFA